MKIIGIDWGLEEQRYITIYDTETFKAEIIKLGV